ncbi:MAG TPA: MFS transporter [Nocardioides sp.]|jgi:predicted MFS family arabinose efflux permease/nucleotide-binding universal stress UspA family protein|nr:MFS transporter [Nocardioides sp.]
MNSTRRDRRAEPLIALSLAAGPVVALGFTRFAYALLLPAMKSDLHWSFAAAGGMNSANAAGYVIGAATAAVWARRYGSSRVFMASLAASAALLLLTGAGGQYAVLASVRFLGGFTTAVTFVLGSALAARIHSGTQHHRSTYLVALYMAGVGIGVVVSGLVVPAVTGALDETAGWRVGWVLLGALASVLLVPAVWAARRVPEPSATGTSTAESVGLSRLTPTFVWYLLYGAGYVSYMTFVVALLHTRGVGTVGEAVFFITLGTVSVIATLTVWGRVLGHLHGGHAPALITVVVLLGVLPVLISRSTGAALVSAVVFGAGFMAGPTAATVLARRMLPAHGWTTGIALLTVAFSVGQGIGPLVAGILSDSAGGITRGLWLSVILLALAAAAALAQREPGHAHAVDAVAEPRTAPVSIQRILLAVDGSSRDTSAEALALALARTLHATVGVLHVDTEAASDESPEHDGVAAAVARLTESGVAATGHVVRAPEMDVADAIAETATVLGADLVIAAPRHRDRLGRWLEPSITEQLTEQLTARSSAAVLLVA